MTFLATVDDVVALGVVAEESAIAAALAKASARFRSEAANDITVSEFDMVLRQYGGRVRLPRTPVVSVTSVRLLNLDGSDGPALVGFAFDGIDTITVSDDWPVINGPGIVTPTVRVQWSAGFAEIPEDVRWAVASMVERALSTPASGVASETIGDYTWRGGGYTASGAFSMSKDELATAHAYRPRSSTMSARVG
jgi:hypothetical protein